ncbi:universal stress protein [Gelidibacter maritimus]|uniref:Universal stress protein n=1 Tax=Gelidibacter maritimus TaxID=2761487 RepID=A0A7W2M445_9FLAO|nr:universal stress protein [Gelidibacter maritimus]MBA6152340.1 universal stress protein [Gelidibacter maritimus]
MKNILLPTDFSDNSLNAIRYTIQLFEHHQCTFHLFNAYTPVVYDLTYVLQSPAQFGLRDPIRAASQKGLDDLITKLLKAFGTNPNHKFETIARFETLIAGIKELISERNIDLVVMGTKGATGAKKILFGSNTVQVFREVKFPVLAIPSDFEYVVPKEILFPTDLEVEFSATQLHALKEIAKLHNSKINALHVNTGYGFSDEQHQNKNKLPTFFDKMAYEFHDVEDMEIPAAIDKFKEEHDIDLLVMINNKHSFFENLFFKDTINQIGFYLNIPFLVIPSKQQ